MASAGAVPAGPRAGDCSWAGSPPGDSLAWVPAGGGVRAVSPHRAPRCPRPPPDPDLTVSEQAGAGIRGRPSVAPHADGAQGLLGPSLPPPLPPSPQPWKRLQAPPGLAPARIWDGSPREGLGTRVLSLGTASLAADGGWQARVSAWPLPRRRHLAWVRRALSAAGTDSARCAHRLSRGQGLALGSCRARGWTRRARAPGGGREMGSLPPWHQLRSGVRLARAHEWPQNPVPKRTAGRGLPGGAGGRGPVTSPHLQNMNHPHTRPAPNPGPRTQRREQAGRPWPVQLGWAPSSPVWLLRSQPALQAGETLVAATPPQPQYPAL